MPTLIVPDESNPKDGKIKQQDLMNIIGSFQGVQLQLPNRPIIKVDTVSVPALMIKNLLDKIDVDIDKANINVKFSVTLPNQKDCGDETIDVSNRLTIALVIESNDRERMAVGDFVITAGFREYVGPIKLRDGICCPVIKPGQQG